jgi:hypothetical protein
LRVITPVLRVAFSTKSCAAVTISKRLVDRDFSKREDRLFMFKLLSYVFEKRGDALLKDQDVFVRFNNFAVMIYSEFRDGIQQIRLNSFLPQGEDSWIKSKNNRPIFNIDVKTNDLMDYVPCTIKSPTPKAVAVG